MRIALNTSAAVLLAVILVASGVVVDRVVTRTPTAASPRGIDVAVVTRTGDPIGGVAFRAVEISSGRVENCTSNDNGYCRFTFVPPVRIDASKAGYRNYWIVGGDPSRPLVVSLDPAK